MYTEIDLSQAHCVNATCVYQNGRIYGGGSYLDFIPTDFVMEFDTVYEIQVDYDQFGTYIDGYSVTGPTDDDYFASYFAYLNNSVDTYDLDGNPPVGKGVYTFKIGPLQSPGGEWEQARKRTENYFDFDCSGETVITGARWRVAGYTRHSKFIPLDETLIGAHKSIDSGSSSQWGNNGNYYTTGTCTAPDVAVFAWSTQGYQNVMFEARAVRWTDDYLGELGPEFTGPLCGPPSGTQYDTDGELTQVVTIGPNLAFILPGSTYQDDDTTLGWMIHVDPDSLQITLLETVHWDNTDVQNDGYGLPVAAVADSERVSLTTGITPNVSSSAIGWDLGWVQFDTAGNKLNEAQWNQHTTPFAVTNTMGVVDFGDHFIFFVYIYGSPSRCDIFRTTHTGGVPDIATATKVGQIDIVFRFDAFHLQLMGNGHVYLCAEQIIGFSAQGAILNLDPADWSYKMTTFSRPLYAGAAGGLQDYVSIEKYTDDVCLFAFQSYFTSTGGANYGFWGGDDFDETTRAHWDSIQRWPDNDEMYCYSYEIVYVGGTHYIALWDGAIYDNPDIAPDSEGQSWAIIGNLDEAVLNIDGQLDQSRVRPYVKRHPRRS